MIYIPTGLEYRPLFEINEFPKIQRIKYRNFQVLSFELLTWTELELDLEFFILFMQILDNLEGFKWFSSDGGTL